MSFSYILVKPDGIKMFEKVKKSLKENSILIKKAYSIQDFDKVAIDLYLDSGAILRGNTPIIVGINEVWKKQYGTTAYLLLVTPSEKMEKSFVETVCAWKKKFREKHIPGAYIGVVAHVPEQTYAEYKVVFSEPLSQKRMLNENEYCYELQMNAIHSPDGVAELKREMRVLYKNGAFRNRISLEGGMVKKEVKK